MSLGHPRRLVLVLRWPRGSTLHNAVLFSLVAHVVFAIAAFTLPGLRGRPDAPPPTLDVVLVAPLVEPAPVQTAPPPPAPQPPPARPEPEPVREPEGPSVTPEDPPEKPVEKPKPKPTPTPKRDPEPEQKPRPRPPAEPAPPVADPDPRPRPAPDEPRGPISSGAAAGALAGMGSEFDWYRDAVIRALYTVWRQPFAANLREPLEVTIAFDINRDGRVSGVRIADESGHSALDRSAFRAVLEAQLPPLPRNHRRNSQPAQFVFKLDPQRR